MGAAAKAGKPLNGHGKCLLPGDGDIAGGMGRGLLDHQHGPRCEGGHLVMNLKNVKLGLTNQIVNLKRN